MNKENVSKICNAFGLGQVQNGPTPVSGGLIHRMYKINTIDGAFAIKELNAEIMKRDGIKEVYIQSEKISAIVKSKQIHAVTALLLNHSTPLLEIDGMIVMVFPWVEGKTLTSDQVIPEHTKKIGSMLAGIHTANIQCMEQSIPEISSISNKQWQAHVKSGLNLQLPWAKAANENLSHLITWSEASREAKQQLNKNLVISHRDLDVKNVLWTPNEEPVLIDWEGAGFINPTAEAISMAIEWSGLTNILFKQDLFSAALQEYSLHCDYLRQQDIHHAIYSLIGGYLDWLEFNMSRSLNSSLTNEQQLGIEETQKTLQKLHFLHDNAHKIIEISSKFSA